MPTHVYRHPEGLGFGQHHAGGADLSQRPAQPPGAIAGLRAAMEMLDPTAEQRAKMETHLAATMADLDMPDGTPVELEAGAPETAEDGRPVVAWTDQFGTARRTAMAPETFTTYFKGA